MLIESKEARVRILHVPGSVPTSSESITLLPGSNIITKENWKKVKADETGKVLVAKGLLVVMTEESSITDMIEPDAIKIVKQTLNISQLEAWAKEEKRAKVLEAITKQMTLVLEGDKKLTAEDVEKMKKEELIETAKKLEIDISKLKSSDDVKSAILVKLEE